jgi:hypothetical protein
MCALFAGLLAIATASIAADVDSPVGTWRLISWQVIVDNGLPQDVFGSHPKGFLVLTREGRLIVLTTAENRRPGMSDHDRAALHKSMVAYSGKYRIEGSDLITTVDLSWNEEWNGTEQSSQKSRHSSSVAPKAGPAQNRHRPQPSESQTGPALLRRIALVPMRSGAVRLAKFRPPEPLRTSYSRNRAESEMRLGEFS